MIAVRQVLVLVVGEQPLRGQEPNLKQEGGHIDCARLGGHALYARSKTLQDPSINEGDQLIGCIFLRLPREGVDQFLNLRTLCSELGHGVADPALSEHFETVFHILEPDPRATASRCGPSGLP